jgi:transcriptional regulator with XRE-family HTH domain
LEEFFSRLRQEREDKGFSLQQIHEKTRINIVYLDALEKGDLKALPKGYDRIFMKSYLLAIGTDVDSFLEEFDRLLGRREPTQVINLDDIEREKQIKAVKITQNIRYLFLWLPMAIILGVLIYIFISFGAGENGGGEEQKIAEIKVEDYLNKLDTSQSAIIVPEPVKSDSIFLVMRGLKKTWVRAVVDRRDTLEYILYKGVDKRLKADSLLQFIIGVGNGVEISTPDTTYRNLARPGEIISRLSIDRKGIRRLIRKKPRTEQAPKDTDEE